MKVFGNSSKQPKRKGAQKLSRKKKKYWRKGTNLDDVESQLVDARLEERLGGPLSKKSDRELFTVDTGRPSTSFLPLGRNEKDRKLRCFAILEPSSSIAPAKVSVPINFKNTKRKKPKKPWKKAVIVPGLDQENDDLADCVAQSQPFYDLWSTEGSAAMNTNKSLPELNDMDLDDEIKRQTKFRGAQLADKRPQTLSKSTSIVPHVEVAHAGASYNPAFEDYQELINKAAEVELQKVIVEEREERRGRLPPIERRATEESRRKELSEGLFVSLEDDSDDSSVHSDEDVEKDSAEADDKDAKKLARKKSKRQRRQAALLQAKGKEVVGSRNAKKRLNEIYSLKRIKAEIKKEEEAIAAKAAKKLASKIDPTRTLKLSKLKYEVPDDEILLPEELPGGLRLLKPEGCLLTDRFKSLQKRNIIETRIRQKRTKKYKRKKYETRSYKAVSVDSKVL